MCVCVCVCVCALSSFILYPIDVMEYYYVVNVIVCHTDEQALFILSYHCLCVCCRLRTFPNTFSASEIIAWLIRNGHARTRYIHVPVVYTCAYTCTCICIIIALFPGFTPKRKEKRERRYLALPFIWGWSLRPCLHCTHCS